MALKARSRLGPYEVVAPLGAGGMGEVYEARDTRLERRVAVKVLPELVRADPRALVRFEREARAVAALSHPSIMAIHDVGEENGVSYVVFELLSGRTLREELAASGPVPARRTVEWGVQLASGLAAAHDRGIVHRDLKPGNVFVTRDGRVKILDFGLAREVVPPSCEDSHAPTSEVPPRLTESGAVLGTAGYMSPEQVRGEPAGPASDIFALGAVLHEMLSGRRAFGGATFAESASAILRDDPPVLEGVPPGLGRVVARCLEKRPESRFRSAHDLAFALEAASAAPPSSSFGSAVAPRLPRVPVLVGAGGVVLIAFAAGFVLAELVPRRADLSYAHPARVASGSGRQFGPAISPDGKWVAYLEESGGRVDVWTRFLAGGDAVNLTARSDLEIQRVSVGGGLEISPDGTQVLFGVAESGAPAAIWAIPAPLGGTARKLFSDLRCVRFSPDGRRVVGLRGRGSRGDALVVVDATGDSAREIVMAEGAIHTHWPAWSRDGRYVYFIRSPVDGNEEPAEIWRVPADGGRAEPFVSTPRRAVYPVPLSDGLLYAANPDGVELALYFRPFGRGPTRRLTTGFGSFTDLRATPDGARLVSTFLNDQERLVLYPLDGGPPRPIGDAITGNRDPAMLPGGRIVFSSTRSGARNLWMSALDGSDPRPVTSGAGFDERPAVSPDGETVAFVSERDGSRGIWIVPLDGGAPRLLIHALVHDKLAFSSDGGSLLFTGPGGERPALFRVAVADGRVIRVATPGGAHAPATSAEGSLVAYLEPTPAGPSVARYLDARGAPALAGSPDSPIAYVGTLALSRDGRLIAIVDNPFATDGVIWVGEPGGTFRRLASLGKGIRARGAAFTEDGKGLVVGQGRSNGDVVVLSREE